MRVQEVQQRGKEFSNGQKGAVSRGWNDFTFKMDDHDVVIDTYRPLCERLHRGIQTTGVNLAKHLGDRRPGLVKESVVSSVSYWNDPVVMVLL